MRHEHFGFSGILSAIRRAVSAVVHTTMRATPSQLVFGRDALLNVSFEADWQYIKARKQKLIVQNNIKENAKRVPHTYNVGDTVMIRLHTQRKHGSDKYTGPHTLTTVNDNGTVTLRKDANGGAVHETWNIRNLEPCATWSLTQCYPISTKSKVTHTNISLRRAFTLKNHSNPSRLNAKPSSQDCQ